MMPRWTRWPLRLPYLPLGRGHRGAGERRGDTEGIRWAMGSAPPLPDRV